MALCSSAVRPAVFHQSNAVSGSRLQVERGCCRVTCRKEGIHPEVHKEATVYCNGELVMTTQGTSKEYIVDVWSGNHPFFQGSNASLITEQGRVDKFKQRFGNLGTMSAIPILTKGEIVIEKKVKDTKKGKGKK